MVSIATEIQNDLALKGRLEKVVSLAGGIVTGCAARIIGEEDGLFLAVFLPLYFSSQNTLRTNVEKAENYLSYGLGLAISHSDIILPAIISYYQNSGQ